jgi:serine/threonine-protein kinase RsbT
MGPESLDIPIKVEDDIVRARVAGRDMCRELGLSEINQVKIATAISELARNIFHYAKTGNISLRRLAPPRPGIEIIAIDRGPGIPNMTLVLSGQYKSKTGMGKGLFGTKRLVDFFDVDTGPNKGTRITLRKYAR